MEGEGQARKEKNLKGPKCSFLFLFKKKKKKTYINCI